jgi:hypothetical protein
MVERAFAGRHEEVQLAGSIDLPEIGTIAASIWRKAQRQSQIKYILECSCVSDISREALLEILKLQQNLRTSGSDLRLANCRQMIRERLADHSLQVLLDEPDATPRPTPKSVQLAIRYMRGLEFTYHWLN